MPKVVLVSYSGYPFTPSSLMPDNGLASLAGALVKEGCDVEILDFGDARTADRLMPVSLRPKLAQVYESFSRKSMGPLQRLHLYLQIRGLYRAIERHQQQEAAKIANEVSEHIRKEKADVVGLKLWGGDGFAGAKLIAQAIRKDSPNVRIYGGGPQAQIFKSTLLGTMPLDAVCYGEGERTLVELVKRGHDRGELSGIPNLFFEDSGAIAKTPAEEPRDLDSLPMPIYDPEVYRGIEAKLRVFIVDETRGCRFCCPFCLQSAKESNPFRAKTASRIVDEIEAIVSRFKCEFIRFGGQMTPGPLLESIAAELLRRQIKVKYSSFGHVNTTRNADFAKIRESGMEAMFFGVESGSPELLEGSLGEPFGVNAIESAIATVKSAGIKAITSFIYPAPFETAETKRQTMDLILRMRPDSVLVYFAGLYPHTRWARNPEKYGITLETDDYEKAMLQYKILHIFPPTFWKPVPYRLNGKSFKQFSRETVSFADELREHGVPLFISDEQFLLAVALREDPEMLAGRLRRMFFTGDIPVIETMVREVNCYEH